MGHNRAGFSYVDLEEIEPAGPGGAVRFVRRELGATAFGFNHITLPPGASGHEHDEADSGQEEVIVVLSGAGTLRVGEDEIELRPGRFVRLDAAATRLPVAGPDGLAFVTFGAPPEAPYVARGPF
jgi:quercetin dioxygenase-like cupin family protein